MVRRCAFGFAGPYLFPCRSPPAYEAAAGHACSSLSGVFLQAHVSRLDAQLAAVRHRVARVDHQIQDYLFDVPGICLYAIEVVVQHYRELDVLLDQSPAMTCTVCCPRTFLDRSQAKLRFVLFGPSAIRVQSYIPFSAAHKVERRTETL
jgi:hypothetical protein